MALALNVTRRPFSFLGQQPANEDSGRAERWGGFPRLKRKGIWHERLTDYSGSPAGRDQFEAHVTTLGEAAGVKFDFNAYIDRQPIESQRLLLWAGRFGKGEEFMTALSDRHFQRGSEGESASKRTTLLAACDEVGLDRAAAEAFLDSNELHDEVWRSYGEMPRKGITGIPLFCFSIPEVGLWSGPFRDANADATINGSGNKAQFRQLFEQLYQHTAKALGEALKRDEAPPPLQGSGGAAAAEGAAAEDGAAKLRASGLKGFVGQEVRLIGLKSRPELNGAVGVCERFDGKQGRYAVRLAGHDQPLAVKAANMELAQDGAQDGGKEGGKEGGKDGGKEGGKEGGKDEL